jgi:hypothetical protein
MAHEPEKDEYGENPRGAVARKHKHILEHLSNTVAPAAPESAALL